LVHSQNAVCGHTAYTIFRQNIRCCRPGALTVWRSPLSRQF
jgi:hypothetical protein